MPTKIILQRGENTWETDFPEAWVDRFRTLLPNGMDPAEAVSKIIRKFIGEQELRNYAEAQGQLLQDQIAQREADLNAELGLGGE